MIKDTPRDLTTIPIAPQMWNRFFTVSPLVLVGTKEESGEWDLAPKHMATPLGFFGYYAFVCTPDHATYWNAKREGVFTVSYPIPSQVVLASLAAAPRAEGDEKPALAAIATFPATRVDGVLVCDAYLYLECELERIVDGFGANSLIVGRVVEAHAREDALRSNERDDQEVIHQRPLLAYLYPGRYAPVESSNSFPFPDGMAR